jgi:hypothetical protein
MYSFSWPAGEYAEHTVRQGKATGALGTAICLGSFKGQEPQATGALGTAICLGSSQGQEPSEVFSGQLASLLQDSAALLLLWDLMLDKRVCMVHTSTTTFVVCLGKCSRLHLHFSTGLLPAASSTLCAALSGQPKRLELELGLAQRGRRLAHHHHAAAPSTDDMAEEALKLLRLLRPKHCRATGSTVWLMCISVAIRKKSRSHPMS